MNSFKIKKSCSTNIFSLEKDEKRYQRRNEIINLHYVPEVECNNYNISFTNCGLRKFHFRCFQCVQTILRNLCTLC